MEVKVTEFDPAKFGTTFRVNLTPVGGTGSDSLSNIEFGQKMHQAQEAMVFYDEANDREGIILDGEAFYLAPNQLYAKGADNDEKLANFNSLHNSERTIDIPAISPPQPAPAAPQPAEVVAATVQTVAAAVVTSDQKPSSDVEGFIANDYFQRVNQGFIQNGQPAEYQLGGETFTVTPGEGGAINIEQKTAAPAQTPPEQEAQRQQQQRQQEMQQQQLEQERQRQEQEQLEQQRRLEQERQVQQDAANPRERTLTAAVAETLSLEEPGKADWSNSLGLLGQFIAAMGILSLLKDPSTIMDAMKNMAGGQQQGFEAATPQQLTAAAGPGAAVFDTDNLKADIVIKTADGNDYVITENIDHFAVAPNEDGGFTVSWQNDKGEIVTAPVEEADSFGINQDMVQQGLANVPKPAPAVQPGLQQTQTVAMNWTQQQPGMGMGV